MPGADAQQIEGAGGGEAGQARPRRRLRRWPRRIAAGAAVVALAAGSTAWLARERIAADAIDAYLAENGVAATYDIVSLTPRRQVIANLVIGDPARPDLTISRMVITLGAGWQGPEVRDVRVEGARLYASLRGGRVSLGALDPLVFTDSDAPPRLPAFDLTLHDARALVESDYGRIGVKLEGAGRLDDGFVGILAASAPGIGTDGCRAAGATLYGRLTTSGGAPALDGPLRLAGLECASARLGRADIGTRASLRPDFAAAEAELAIRGAGGAYGDLSGEGLSGTARMGWSDGRIALAHDLALIGLAAPQGRLARLSAAGAWRGTADGASGQWEGSLHGTGLVPAPGLAASLAEAARGAEGTLAAPLLDKARAAIAASLAGANIAADATLRHKGSEAALVIPEASLATRRGKRVLALSRASAGLDEGGLTGLSGNMLAGGEGLPEINGRIAQGPDGGWAMRLAMADYAAGPNRLAIPSLTLRAAPGGAVRFDGLLTASGDLPGGRIESLALPLDGTWSRGGGLALGTRCAPLRFADLAFSGLALKGQAITLCPERGGPIIAWRDGLRLAARTGAVRIEGIIGESPASLAAGGAVLRYPGTFRIENLAASIGSDDSAVSLAAASLEGSIAGETAGTFAGGSARLAAVPFDLAAIGGRWAFAEGAVKVTGGAFTLSDRPVPGSLARFAPLVAEGAGLTFADNRITADARLSHPGSGRAIADVAVTHDLGTAAGGARFTVPGVTFDAALQPHDLSDLAKGVIALAAGTVSGNGRIDWRGGEEITSSGTFASDGFDFAAAFGPVRGLAGKLVFTDLVNLTTAPDQHITVAAINPGVEVLAGMVQFELRDGTVLRVEDARFPLMGGTLLLRPLEMDFGKPEERRYVFEVVGLDAAQFVAQMELTNISATGTFDGTVPIVFDNAGNGRIEGGMLIARPGGGNVAYVGELTYEDLGTMGNYAFSALRSLDYRQMSVGLGGDLAGEIITSFNFDGVRQGAGTSRNFITRRLSRLPIRFRVNVRSENFYELATMVRSFWNAGYLGNLEDRVRVENGRLVPRDPVQSPESEGQP